MRIGFGCTVLARGLNRGGVDGIGSYTRELGKELSVQKNIQLTPVLFREMPGESFPFDGEHIRYAQRFSIMAGMAAFAALPFPKLKAKPGIDIFHATDHLVPKLSNTPVVATLMDAIPLTHPEWLNTRFAQQKNWLWKQTAQWADHILTISEYSKQEIATHFKIDPEKISVIPLGVNECFFDRFSQDQKREITHRYGLPDQFYLFLGTLQPRKNVERLLDAHAMLPMDKQKEIPLVIVGREGWGCETLVRRLKDNTLSGRVYWLKYLPEIDVRLLMQAASALVFPSLCEGFGLPVVEAFASELPVIVSNTTAFPEIAQDAALLVDPMDVGQISQAMRQITESPSLTGTMVANGKQRARELNWQTCAKRTADIYQRLLNTR